MPGFATGNWAARFTLGLAASRTAVLPWNLNTNAVTLAAWVNPNGAQNPNEGLIFCRGGSTVAVVGLSSSSWRHSYSIARYLQSRGYEITPVNPNETEVLGQRAYPGLRDLPEPPEVVDVFRRPEFVPGIVDDAIAVGAKALWLQSGVIDYQAARRAREAGLLVVMDRCIAVELGRR